MYFIHTFPADEGALPFPTKTKLEKKSGYKSICMRLDCNKTGTTKHHALRYGKLCKTCFDETDVFDETETTQERFVGGLHAALADNSGSKFKVAEGAPAVITNVGVGTVIGESISYIGYILHTIASINEGGGATRKEIYEYIKQQQGEYVYYCMVDNNMNLALNMHLITESGQSVSEYIPPTLVFDGVDLPMRSKKDPEAPKRPMSGKFCVLMFNVFILYINQHPYPTSFP